MIIPMLLVTAPVSIPAPFRGDWADSHERCRSRDPRDHLHISPKRFRDASVVSIYRKGPTAIEVTLRIPSGQRVRLDLVLGDRGQSLDVVEELGIMGYVRCTGFRA